MKILKFYNSQSPLGEYSHLITTFDFFKYNIYFPIEEIDFGINSSAATQYNVTVNPTVILINEDREVRRISGVFSVSELEQFLEA